MLSDTQIKTYKDFPSTRYQGSKRKILEWIYTNLKDIDFNTVLDAFGGTGAVSYLFKTMGKEITYNDYLKFNNIIGKAIIENNDIIINEKEINELIDVSDITGNSNFISEEFKDIYFTDEENIWLDKFIFKIENYFDNDYNSQYKKAIAYYGLFQACLTKRPYNLFHRKNLYMRLNDVERNFGNKTTWEKPFTEQVVKFINEANNSIFSTGISCKSTNEDAFNIKGDFDLVYIDPPYVNKSGMQETIDYLSCYHFLEGIIDYNNWKEQIDFNSKNLRFKKSKVSDKFRRQEVLDSFDLLFNKFKNSIIVVSYKKNGTPSVDEIIGLLKKYKKKVKTESMHYKYALNKQNGNAKDNREVLFIAS